MEAIFRFVIFLCVLLLAKGNSATNCEDPLVCYLNSLVFRLPDFCTTLSNGKDLCVENFECDGIQISALPSYYKRPTKLGFGIHGLGTSCAARTKYGRLPGEISVAITDTTIDGELLIRKKGEYPSLLRLPVCNVSSIDVAIDFSDPILEAFAGELSKVIETAVYKATCVGLNALLVTNVTQFVNDKLNPALLEIASSAPSPFPDYNDRYLDWNQSIVTKVHHAVDRIQGLANLPDFVRCMINDGSSLFEVVNGILQALPWQVNFPQSLHLYGSKDFSISLFDIDFTGFETLENLEILEPISESKVALRSGLSFDRLALNVSMRVQAQKQVNGEMAIYDENIMLTIVLEDIAAIVDMVVAFDDHYLQSMYMDQLSNLGCWVQPLSEISIPNFDVVVNPTKVSIVQISGSAGALEADITGLIDNVFLLLLNPDGFNQLVQDVLRGAIQGPVRNKVNNDLATILLSIRSEQPCLSHYPYNDEVNLIDWRYSKMINLINGLVNEYLGPQGINQMITCATQGTGTLSVETKFLNIAISGLNSFYAFSLLSPLTTSNTVNAVYELVNSVGLGFCDGSACNPLAITVSGSRAMIDSIATSLSSSLARSLSTYRVSISMNNLYLGLTSLLAWDFNKVRDLQQKQLSQTGCFTSTVQNASLQNASLQLSSAQLSISTITEGVQAQRNISKGLSALFSFITSSKHISNHNSNMNSNLQMAAATCANGGVQPEVTTQDNEGVSVHDNNLFLGSLSWQWELFVLCVASSACLAGLVLAYNYWGSSHPHVKGHSPSLFRFRCFDYGASLLDYDSDSDVDSERESNISDSLLLDGSWGSRMVVYWHRWHCGDSLIFNRRIPLIIRYAVPLVILGNISLFIQSNLAEDAVSVMVSVATGSTVHDVGSIFDFGLGSTVHDMWGAGVYPLAILIAFFSGAWPYVKLVVMLTAWVVPPGLMTKERRESLLVILDMLGKWSLVDFFVMVLMLCAFYFELVVYPEVMVVTVTVKPEWGFYCFLLATMISLGLGHTILACHRLVTEPKLPMMTQEQQMHQPLESLASSPYHVTIVDWDKQEELELLDRIAEEELALSEDERGNDSPQVNSQSPAGLGIGAMSLTHDTVANGRAREHLRQRPASRRVETGGHSFSSSVSCRNRTHDLQKDSVSKYFPAALVHQEIRITGAGTAAIAVVLIASIFSVIAGVWLKTMGFHFEGLTGYMLKSASKVDYSYISIGTALPTHSGVPNSFAIRWLQASYILFGVAMPLAFLLSLVGLWLVPLTLRRQRQLHVLSEVFNAWSTLDVFCVSIVAALLEIRQFAAFIVGDSCDGINQVLGKPTLDDKLDGDDKCFDVEAFVKAASWVLFLAATLLIVLGIPSLSAAHATIKRRLHELEAQFPHSHRHESTILSNKIHDAPDHGVEDDSNRRLLADEEALRLGLESVDAQLPDESQRTSDLSRPLLETFSSASNSQHVLAQLPATVNTDNFQHRASEDSSRRLEIHNTPIKSARWLQREERALQALQRHRQTHRIFRAIRLHFTSQAMAQGSLKLLSWFGLVTVSVLTSPVTVLHRRSTEHTVEPREESPRYFQDSVPRSPALHFSDIYQHNTNSPLAFPYSHGGNILLSPPASSSSEGMNNSQPAMRAESAAVDPLVLSAPSLLTC